MPSPEAFFQLAHAPAGVLDEIFRSHERLDEAELHASIKRHEGAERRSPESVSSAPLEAAVLVPVADAEDVHELLEHEALLLPLPGQDSLAKEDS